MYPSVQWRQSSGTHSAHTRPNTGTELQAGQEAHPCRTASGSGAGPKMQQQTQARPAATRPAQSTGASTPPTGRSTSSAPLGVSRASVSVFKPEKYLTALSSASRPSSNAKASVPSPPVMSASWHRSTLNLQRKPRYCEQHIRFLQGFVIGKNVVHHFGFSRQDFGNISGQFLPRIGY